MASSSRSSARRGDARFHRLAAIGVGVLLLAGVCTTTQGSTGSTEPPELSDFESALQDRAPGGRLVFAAEHEPTGFNGNTSRNATVATKNVTENLFFYAVKARPDSGIDFVGLEREPRLVSDQPQVIEWQLRRDAIWSDGSDITVADVQHYFEQVMLKDPARRSVDDPTGYVNDVASRVGYDQITRFTRMDDKTFQVEFDPPYGDYRGLWTDIPQARFMRAQPGGWDTGLNDSPGPSAGPYVFEEWNRGDSLVLVRNDRWWGSPKPTLDTIVFRFLPDAVSQVTALRNREVDLIYPQPQLDLVETIKSLPEVSHSIGFGPTFEHLTFNLRHELLADKAVRQAIAWGIDRDAIVAKLLKPFSPKAVQVDNSVVLLGQPGYEPHGAEYRSADPARARAALDRSGYVRGADGIYAKAGRRLSFRLATTADNDLRRQQAALMRNQLADVGIELRIETFSGGKLFGALADGDFDIANFAWAGGPFPVSAAKGVWETGSGSNFGGYSSPAFDRAAKRGARELDLSKQLELANAMDEALWDDLPVLPLYQKPTLLAVRNTFVNVSDNPTNEGPFWRAQAWGLRKKAS